MSMHPTTLLILGSMDEFVCLVQRAKARGCRVLVADGYEHGPARAYADASFVIPITDTAALADLCREHQVDALITSFSDVLFEEGCRVAHAADLPAPLALDKLAFLRDKGHMKEMFDQLNITYPTSRVVAPDRVLHACEGMRFPCVMKPIDGYGSYGVRVVRSAAEASAAADEVAAESKRAARIVLEEYDDGHEFNMIMWVSNGRVFPVSVADREKTERSTTELPHVSRIVYPSRYSHLVTPCALDYAQRVVDFTGIEHGPLCMQFFWSPESGVRVCEVTGRVFGYEHELLEYASGLSIEDLLLDTALDHRALAQRLEKHDALSMPMKSCGLYFHVYDGTVADLSGARSAFEVPSLQNALFYYAEKDHARTVRGGQPYAARAFLAGPTYEQLDQDSAQVYAQFSILDANGINLAIPNAIPANIHDEYSHESLAKEGEQTS